MLDPKRPAAPLGERLLEVPVDLTRFESSNSRTIYRVYAPFGNIDDGKRPAVQGGPGIPVCSSCHGAKLDGGVGPPLAGRSPSNVLRQLFDFRCGARAGAGATDMIELARRLNPAQTYAVAAYPATLQ